MKKKIIIAVCILLALVLLTPMRYEPDDGGTVAYEAVLYRIYDVHTLNPDMESEQEYLEGVRVYVLGMEVFDNVN